MSYYDLDAILTDGEKVPCKFEIEVADLGYLDNNPSSALKAGTSIPLPLWLAEILALSTRAPNASAYVELNLPRALSDNVMNALKADPRAVPLRDQSHNFYALGTRMLDLFEEREMCAVMRRAFVRRAGELALHARKAGATGEMASGGGEEFTRGLEEWERILFRTAHDGAKAMKEWMETSRK